MSSPITSAIALLLLASSTACNAAVEEASGPDGGVAPPRVDGGGGELDEDASPPPPPPPPPPTVDEWPLPVPGAAGTGAACPEPAQVLPGSDWPEVFVGVEGCDDAGAGTREQPFCTFARAFEVADSVPGIVTVLDGTYRQRSHALTRAGTAESYFLIRADDGATPVILGSDRIEGAAFEDVGGGLFRADASGLEQDAAGLWAEDGTRIIHVMEMRDGVRSHAPTSAIVEAGQWTKADASGAGCGSDNAGCYIYLRPHEGEAVSSTAFEASQGNFIFAGASHYMVVDGISTRYTQSTAIFFEGATNIVIEDGDFAHNANSNDNSYNLRLWGTDGAIVRRNRVSDSRYWGGAVNSHGITFMITGADADIWVCQNEIFDSIGMGVSTKGGSSNVHVVGNWLHDLGSGVHVPGSRCHWRGCDVREWPGGAYDVRENLFERCGSGVDIGDRAGDGEGVAYPSRIYNNVFVDTPRGGIYTSRASTQPFVRNNLFLGTGSGIYLSAGGTTTWPDYYLGRGFDSDHNFFATGTAVYVRANWSGMERAMSLDEYRAEYDGEARSLAGDDPGLGDLYFPLESSALRGAGDPSVYDGASTVHIGLWPFAE